MPASPSSAPNSRRFGNPRFRALPASRASLAGIPGRACRSARSRRSLLSPRGVRAVPRRSRTCPTTCRPATPAKSWRRTGSKASRSTSSMNLSRPSTWLAHVSSKRVGASMPPTSSSGSRANIAARRTHWTSAADPRAGARRAGSPAGESGARGRNVGLLTEEAQVATEAMDLAHARSAATEGAAIARRLATRGARCSPKLARDGRRHPGKDRRGPRAHHVGSRRIAGRRLRGRRHHGVPQHVHERDPGTRVPSRAASIDEGMRYADKIQQSHCRHVMASGGALLDWRPALDAASRLAARSWRTRLYQGEARMRGGARLRGIRTR